MVHSYRMPPDINNSIKMEVGIEDCLHTSRVQQIQVRPVLLYCVAPNPVLVRRYHLKDVIVGKSYFLLVRIKIKHMELSIIRRETTGAVPNQYNESETITKSRSWTAHPYEARQQNAMFSVAAHYSWIP